MSESQTIYQRALTKFGVDAQLDKAVEEMGELIVAIMHHKSGRGNNICEELADVEIILKQIKLVFNDTSQVDYFKKLKLERLELRIA